MKSAGRILDLLEIERPAGEMSDPAVPDIVLYQDFRGDCRVSGDIGGGRWAQRRCLELMRARPSEDISLDELAAEARLSPFHFARMFKQSVGVPPRVYLTQLRMEKVCELLEQTDLSVTEIALEAGYSSNQVLARVFLKHMRLSPSDYRRAVRDPARQTFLHTQADRPFSI